MTKRVLLAGALLACCASAPSYAQSTGAVRGKVSDDKGQPVEGAEIGMDFQGGITRKYALKTNKKGEFAQIGLPFGTYNVVIRKEGFQSVSLSPRINPGEPTDLGDNRLLPAAVALAKQQAEAKGKGGDLSAEFNSAYKLMQEGKLDEAKAAFEAILVKQPNVPEAHFNLGHIAAQKKDLVAAEAAYKKSLEIRSDFVPAYGALADLYEGQGDRPKALAFLKQAAADHPDDGAILYQVGWSLFNRGQSAEAKPLIEKAATLQSDNPEVFYLLGTIAVGEGDIPKAVTNLEKYLAMSPKNPQNVGTAQQLIAALKPKK
jgi:tetratricopeptide (TPR) repeat protein